MSVKYDIFIGDFLEKVTERDLLMLAPKERDEVVLGYMKRSIAGFKKNCLYDLTSTRDDVLLEFNIDIREEDLDEIVDIVSEGMLVQWLKPMAYKKDLYENVINTRDFSQYSPAELLLRVGEAYKQAKREYTQKIREYSFNHGELTELHS